jgi:hypothetical protein
LSGFVTQRKIPARLDVLLAPKARKAVVLRRGPAKFVCTVGWDLSNDSFQVGQWVKGRIHGYCCDLSPGGGYFVYYVVGASRGEYETWTSISLAPYLKAVGRYAVSSGLPGGGFFLAENRCWFQNAWRVHQECADVTEESNEPEDEFNHDWRKIYFRRLHRDGWTVEKKINQGERLDAFTWIKTIGKQWVLKNCIEPSGLGGLGHGEFIVEYQVVNFATGDVQKCRDWEWADVDGSRLLWAEGGKIFSADIEAQGLGPAKMLHDFNDMTFQEIEAPY